MVRLYEVSAGSVAKLKQGIELNRFNFDRSGFNHCGKLCAGDTSLGDSAEVRHYLRRWWSAIAVSGRPTRKG